LRPMKSKKKKQKNQREKNKNGKKKMVGRRVGAPCPSVRPSAKQCLLTNEYYMWPKKGKKQ